MANKLQVAVPTITNDMKTALELAQKRFNFNVNLIEEKYCRKSSGLVYDFNTDEVTFDENLCTAENDEELMKAMDKQSKSLEHDFGSTVMSAAAVAPEDSELNGKRILKINTLFYAMHDISTQQQQALSQGPSTRAISNKKIKAISPGPSEFLALPSTTKQLKALPAVPPKKNIAKRTKTALAILPPQPAVPRRLSSRRVVTDVSESAIVSSGVGRIVLRSGWQCAKK